MMEDGLGELEDIGQFGLGIAVRDAKPVNKLELSKEKEAEIAKMEQWEAYKEVDEDLRQEQEDAAQLDRMRRNKKSQSDRRPPTDRQTAFVEFKSTDDAKEIEQVILDCRGDLKNKRNDLRNKTEEVNMIKGEIDQLKAFLDDKTEKKKQSAITQSMAPGFNSNADGFDMDDDLINEVIDEEELVKLKEVKELKKQYRVAYKELKELRAEAKYTQTGIDNSKENLIKKFEEWYEDNFETEAEYKKRQAEMRSMPNSNKATPANGVRIHSEADEDVMSNDGGEREGVDVDSSALAYIRSRKAVHKLNAARKDMLKV